MDKRLARIKEIRDELFDMANSFAGDKTGTVAVELHSVCNKMGRDIQMIENGIKPEDNTRQVTEWFANNPTLMKILAGD
jgi:hypothetical protein